MRMRIRQKQISDLFPLHDPLSPIMFRLAVLREDLVFETLNLDAGRPAREEDRGQVFCTVMYFVRRLTISVTGIRDALAHPEVGKLLKEQRVSEKILDPVREGRDALEKLDELLRGIRDGVGAHANHSIFEAMLTKHGNVRGFVQIGDGLKSTFLRLPYELAFYASQGITDFGDKDGGTAAIKKTSTDIKTSLAQALRAVDHVLAFFWHKHRVFA